MLEKKATNFVKQCKSHKSTLAVVF